MQHTDHLAVFTETHCELLEFHFLRRRVAADGTDFEVVLVLFDMKFGTLGEHEALRVAFFGEVVEPCDGMGFKEHGGCFLRSFPVLHGDVDASE